MIFITNNRYCNLLNTKSCIHYYFIKLDLSHSKPNTTNKQDKPLFQIIIDKSIYCWIKYLKWKTVYNFFLLIFENNTTVQIHKHCAKVSDGDIFSVFIAGITQGILSKEHHQLSSKHTQYYKYLFPKKFIWNCEKESLI